MQAREERKMPMPKITVVVPCDCPGRWFQCKCGKGIVAEYQCHRDLDDTGMTHPDDIEYVAALHPGMALICL